MEKHVDREEEAAAKTLADEGGVSPRRAELHRGACIGRYVMIDSIGEGGMGIVYKAYDPELERPVAIKLVHASGEDPSAISVQRDRLLREAKALARLAHPNVLAVFDVGTFGDDVFLATEFVEGRTLGAWLRETKRSQAEILRAFVAAGEGLAAAHRAGLVHRDFKPANVIVGKDGRVRVLDFGLARADAGAGDDVTPHDSLPIAAEAPRVRVIEAEIDRDLATMPASPRGSGRAGVSIVTRPPSSDSRVTPSYGSHSSLSSGSMRSRRSLLESPLTEFGQIVGTPRFMAPEQHCGLTVDARSDQFGFCVTLYDALYGQFPFEGSREAYEKNVIEGKIRPAPPKSDVPRRLRNVLMRGLSTLPEDRYPSMDALLADLRRDPSAARRRVATVAAVSLALMLGIGAARGAKRDPAPVCQGASSKLAGVWDDDRKSALHAAFAASGSPFAEDAFQRTSASLDAYTRSWVGMHVEACEATRVRGDQSEEMLDLRVECLQARLAEVKAQVDVLVHADARMVEKAVPAVRALPPFAACADAAALRAPIRPPEGADARARVEVVRTDLAGAKALQRAGRYADAKASAARVAEDAKRLAYRPLEAEALYLLGDLEDDLGDYASSERTLRRAAAAAIAGRHETLAARAFNALVVEVGLRQARFADAHEWAVLASAAIERPGIEPLARGELSRNVGRVLYREGKYAESHAEIEKCLAIWEPAFGREDYAVAGALTDLGNVSFAEGRYEDALATYHRSLAIHEKTLGPEHPSLAPDLNNVGEVMMKLGEYERATGSLDRARALWERAFGADHPKVALALENLALTASRRGDPERALPDAERALAIWRSAHGAEHPDVALGIHGVAEVLLAQRKYDRALAEYEKALAMREKVLGAQHVDLADTLVGIGETRLAMHAPQLAVAQLERAVALREAHPGDAVDMGDARFALARALSAAHQDPARAAKLAEEARSAYASAAGPLGKARLAAVTTWQSK